ncbi:uncharacterized protein LOC135388098 [Ornithodoros turicata]|uniref:uncharacterized protein LOC135388098 n=1 Tax=Ornithodoros turicata TaxID=34597 RepID=UPI003139C9C7
MLSAIIVFAVLFAGTASEQQTVADQFIEDVLAYKLPEKMESMSLNSIAIQQLTVHVNALSEKIPERDIILRNGRIDNMAREVRRHAKCRPTGADSMDCFVTIDGTVITFQGIERNRVNVDFEIKVSHSVIDITVVRGEDGKATLKSFNVQAVYPWVYKPVEFSALSEQDIMLESNMKDLMREVIRGVIENQLMRALKAALEAKTFPAL